jgi:hypothetical protein
VRSLAARLSLVAMAACEGSSEPAAPIRVAATPAREDTPSLPEARELPLPAGPGSVTPDLSVDAQDVLRLSWVERGPGDTAALRLTVQDPRGGWSETDTVIQADDLAIDPVDPPRVAADDAGRAVVVFARGEQAARRLLVTRQTDDGSFLPPRELVPPGPGEVGMVSLAAGTGGDMRVAFVDGRSGPAAALRSTTIRADGTFDPPGILDDRVCECCATASAGEFVAYRDRSTEEIRDIRLAGGPLPTGGVPVHDDGWTIAGCPVAGPALATDGTRLAAAWFTGAAPPGAVNVAFSADPRRLGMPVRVDGGHPLGRAAVALEPDGAAVVAWLERSPTDPAVADLLVRRVRKDGRAGASRRLATVPADRTAGNPRLALRDTELVVVWTDPGRQGMPRIRAAHAPLAALP